MKYYSESAASIDDGFSSELPEAGLRLWLRFGGFRGTPDEFGSLVALLGSRKLYLWCAMETSQPNRIWTATAGLPEFPALRRSLLESTPLMGYICNICEISRDGVGELSAFSKLSTFGKTSGLLTGAIPPAFPAELLRLRQRPSSREARAAILREHVATQRSLGNSPILVASDSNGRQLLLGLLDGNDPLLAGLHGMCESASPPEFASWRSVGWDLSSLV